MQMISLRLAILLLIICMVASYLLGSINFAIIVTRIFIRKDIRDFGSGNAGATNVLRTVGKTAAALTFLGDVLKGVLSVLLAKSVFIFLLNMPDFFWAQYLCGLCALSGHLFPIFYKFKGGKGVLVSAGAMAAVAPFAILTCLAVFLIVVLITRYVSLSSIVACATFPFALWGYRVLTDNTRHLILEIILGSIFAVSIIIMHKTNIKRLIKGTESKLGSKKQ